MSAVATPLQRVGWWCVPGVLERFLADLIADELHILHISVGELNLFAILESLKPRRINAGIDLGIGQAERRARFIDVAQTGLEERGPVFRLQTVPDARHEIAERHRFGKILRAIGQDQARTDAVDADRGEVDGERAVHAGRDTAETFFDGGVFPLAERNGRHGCRPVTGLDRLDQLAERDFLHGFHGLSRPVGFQ